MGPWPRRPLCLRRWHLSWSLRDRVRAAMLASGRTQEYGDIELRMTSHLASEDGGGGPGPRPPPTGGKSSEVLYMLLGGWWCFLFCLTLRAAPSHPSSSAASLYNCRDNLTGCSKAKRQLGSRIHSLMLLQSQKHLLLSSNPTQAV